MQKLHISSEYLRQLASCYQLWHSGKPVPIRVQVVIFCVSVVILAILTYFINRTKYGSDAGSR